MDDAAAQSGLSDDVVNVVPTSGGGKETEVVGAVEPVTEMIEVKEPDGVPEEVMGWMERVERGEDVHLPQPVVHDDQVIVASVQPGQVKIILPLTQAGVEQGLHLKLFYSLRWLAEWCIRIIKKFPGKVFYKK